MARQPHHRRVRPHPREIFQARGPRAHEAGEATYSVNPALRKRKLNSFNIYIM
jgi:hypothetical protein